MSTSVLRSQTTANLAALASISKAPSTSSLLATTKKLPASGVIHGSGGSKKLTPKIGSASSHLHKFSSRIFSPTKSSAAKGNFGSAQKAGPSNLLGSVTSFLPSKAKPPKPTQGIILKNVVSLPQCRNLTIVLLQPNGKIYCGYFSMWKFSYFSATLI